MSTTGRACPAGAWDALFVPFVRSGCAGDARRPRRRAASGSGLAVARGFAEAMNGSLTPHADARRRARTHAPHARPGAAPVSTVLVVDDDPALVRALTINLRARGYEVHAAGTGAGALQLAAAHPPDAVVLDLGLPDLDGSEVIAGLRGWTDVPILVLSAREQSREKVAALDAGADDYVVKPFGMDELLARLRAAIRRGVARAGGADDRHRRVHDRSRCRAGDRGRRLGHPAHPHRVAPARGAGPQFRPRGRPRAGCSPRCGARPTASRRTTCASTWPRCAASSRPTPPIRGICSPRAAADTASSPDRVG